MDQTIDHMNLLSPAPSRAPQDVSVVRTSGTVITVSWTLLTLEEARGFIQYEVTYRSANGQRKRQESCSSSPCIVSSSSDSVEITGLDPGTAYSVSVRARNIADPALVGEPSEPMTVEGK